MVMVVLLASNPRFVRTDEANRYYSEVVEYLQYLGCIVTIVQPTDCLLSIDEVPDLLVAHGKQVDRLNQLTESPETIVKLSHPDGIISQRDLAWQQAGSQGVPPVEHFVFTNEQRQAIGSAVEEVKARIVKPPPVLSRQAAGNRPGVK